VLSGESIGTIYMIVYQYFIFVLRVCLDVCIVIVFAFNYAPINKVPESFIFPLNFKIAPTVNLRV